MKKLIMAVLSLLALVALFSGALAGTVVVTGDANVRTNPSLNGYRLGSVVQGTWLNYRDVYSIDERGVMWYGVDFNGEAAWVSSRYSYVVYDEDEDMDDDAPVVIVLQDSHVRDWPGLDGESLTVARAGAVLRMGGESRWDNRGVAWHYVFCNGYWGWISSKYTRLAG